MALGLGWFVRILHIIRNYYSHTAREHVVAQKLFHVHLVPLRRAPLVARRALSAGGPVRLVSASASWFGSGSRVRSGLRLGLRRGVKRWRPGSGSSSGSGSGSGLSAGARARARARARAWARRSRRRGAGSVSGASASSGVASPAGDRPHPLVGLLPLPVAAVVVD